MRVSPRCFPLGDLRLWFDGEATRDSGFLDSNAINDLLRNPAESLGVELKSWLDLKTVAGRAKTARALIALRNNNGGVLILGFDDKTCVPVADGRPDKLAEAYHADEIQSLVKDLCLPPFEVTVHLGTRDDQQFPVLVVGAGVRSPVISRQRVVEEVGGKSVVHLRQHAVYVRSVHNGRVESVEPRSPADWDSLTELCFDNREADIGRFLRRHAPALLQEIRGTPPPEAPPQAPPLVPVPPPVPPPMAFVPPATDLVAILAKGETNYQDRVAYLKKAGRSAPSDRKGWREVAIACNGPVRPVSVPKLLEELFTRHPRLSGWPAWIDTRGSGKEESRPYPNQGGWEALVQLGRQEYSEPMVDFWRLEPAGSFYLRRSYEDDVFPQVGENQGKVLDFLLVISRAAEALGTAHVFARTLSTDPETGSLRAEFRWTGLRERQLTCWVEPMRDLWTAVPAYESEVRSGVIVPLNLTLPALTPFVEEAVKPLFTAFGITIGSKIIEEIAIKTLRRTPL